MKNIYLISLALLSLSFLPALGRLAKGAMSVERKAHRAGAQFVQNNPGSTKDDVRNFCGDKYPIYSVNGISDIELRLQTACITGGTEQLQITQEGKDSADTANKTPQKTSRTKPQATKVAQE